MEDLKIIIGYTGFAAFVEFAILYAEGIVIPSLWFFEFGVACMIVLGIFMAATKRQQRRYRDYRQF